MRNQRFAVNMAALHEFDRLTKVVTSPGPRAMQGDLFAYHLIEVQLRLLLEQRYEDQTSVRRFKHIQPLIRGKLGTSTINHHICMAPLDLEPTDRPGSAGQIDHRF